MSESSKEDRTLPPSAKRLEDARREGRVPRSRDLAHLMVLGGAAGLLYSWAGALLADGQRLLARALTLNAAQLTQPAQMVTQLSELTQAGLLWVAPFLITLLGASVAAPLALGGWTFSLTPVGFNLGRINPGPGLVRMVSLATWVQLTKVIVVAVLLGAIGTWFVSSHLDAFATLAYQSLPQGLAHFGQLLIGAFGFLVTALVVTSAIDVPFQLYQHYAQLKMTPEEVKREDRENNGDPQIKARIRAQQREMARKRMMAAVPRADVVVTNPTHYAVALRYAQGSHRAPLVVAKGADAVAARIRELAQEHQVPLLEAPPLARALYRHVELGHEIPAALYSAVAQVLAYVYQLRRAHQGVAPLPVSPPAIEVPPELDPITPLAQA
jgi:flagellar biosynthetic protein FlhB